MWTRAPAWIAETGTKECILRFHQGQSKQALFSFWLRTHPFFHFSPSLSLVLLSSFLPLSQAGSLCFVRRDRLLCYFLRKRNNSNAFCVSMTRINFFNCEILLLFLLLFSLFSLLRSIRPMLSYRCLLVCPVAHSRLLCVAFLFLPLGCSAPTSPVCVLPEFGGSLHARVDPPWWREGTLGRRACVSRSRGEMCSASPPPLLFFSCSRRPLSPLCSDVPPAVSARRRSWRCSGRPWCTSAAVAAAWHATWWRTHDASASSHCPW